MEHTVDKIRVFISLPFTGVEDTIGERLEEGKKYLWAFAEKNGVEAEAVTQSNIDELIEKKASVDDKDYPFFMGKDIQAVLECDAILMCKGWENSKGCKLERFAAETFGIKIIYMQEGDDKKFLVCEDCGRGETVIASNLNYNEAVMFKNAMQRERPRNIYKIVMAQ